MEATRLLVACAFLRSDADRLGHLREQARDVTLDEGFLRASELHGILPLVARNLLEAEASLPAAVAERLTERDKALREEGRRDALTVDRLLAVAEKARVPVVLLKGASLAQDLYDDPLVRSQGDVDVLVADEHVRPLVRAAVEAGLVEAETALPIWWHRLTHFHLKLEPAMVMLKEVEVHWRLHHPSLLLTADHAKLLARSREISVGGHPARTLDSVDRFLHLVTHLASHWVHLPPAPTLETLLDWLRADPPRIRLKWFVDLVAAAEQLSEAVASDVVRERASEWGARRQLDFVLTVVRTAFRLPTATRSWLEALSPAAVSESAPGAGAAREASAASRPLPGLDFRQEALSLWPRWFWPEADYWKAKAPGSVGALLLARRVGHAAFVFGKTLAAGLSLPSALLARLLVRRERRRRRALAMDPERVLDVVMAWKRPRL